MDDAGRRVEILDAAIDSVCASSGNSIQFRDLVRRAHEQRLDSIGMLQGNRNTYRYIRWILVTLMLINVVGLVRAASIGVALGNIVLLVLASAILIRSSRSVRATSDHQSIADVILCYGRCPGCGYDLSGIPTSRRGHDPRCTGLMTCDTGKCHESPRHHTSCVPLGREGVVVVQCPECGATWKVSRLGDCSA